MGGIAAHQAIAARHVDGTPVELARTGSRFRRSDVPTLAHCEGGPTRGVQEFRETTSILVLCNTVVIRSHFEAKKRNPSHGTQRSTSPQAVSAGDAAA